VLGSCLPPCNPPVLATKRLERWRATMDAMDTVSVHEKLGLIHDHWNPRIVADLNGQHVKLVKFQGEFVWHSHAQEDEFFYVIRGQFRMDFRDRSVELGAGDFIVVPKGVEHRPVAEHEVEVMLFEPAEIRHTGDVRSALTLDEFQRN
jgi:mannose-6-phosphate isomerase-like protein (cupin superfamily)